MQNSPRSSLKIDLESLRRIPKVELHRHLECSIRLSTLRELGPAAGIDVSGTEAELKRRLLVAEPMLDLETVLAKFLATQKILHREENLTRLTFEAIEDAAREGVRILELRYAPTYVRLNHEHLSFDQIHRAIAKGVELAKNLPVAVGLIAIVQRTVPMKVAEQVVDFAIAHRGTNRGDLIAIDLADNEAIAETRAFAPLFQRAKAAGLHVTVHAGEDNFPGAPGNVKIAIEELGAERIGHGVQIHRDPEVRRLVTEKRVPLELCPTSNWLTGAVPSTARHPFRSLFESGVLTTLNSDDPGLFDIDLVTEYGVLANEHRFTESELNRINDIAASASFISFDEKQKFWPRPIDRGLAPLSNKA